MTVPGYGWDCDIHKHRVPREPTLIDEGMEVREGLLGKVTS